MTTDENDDFASAPGRAQDGRWSRRAVLRSFRGSLLAVEIESEGEEPRWLIPTLQHFEEILQLRAGWDSYRALPIETDAVARAVELLGLTMRLETPAPLVIPTNRGGVQLEWHQRGMDIEVEIDPAGRVHMFSEDLVYGTESEDDLDSNQEPLAVALAELSGRRA